MFCKAEPRITLTLSSGTDLRSPTADLRLVDTFKTARLLIFDGLLHGYNPAMYWTWLQSTLCFSGG
jgi:hypothetical protein